MQVQDVAGQRDVAGEAQLFQVQGVGLQPAPHLLEAELASEPVVLDHGEAQLVALPEEQRSRLRPGEAPRLRQNALEERRQILLAGEIDSDLHQVFEGLSQIQRWYFRLPHRALRANVAVQGVSKHAA